MNIGANDKKKVGFLIALGLLAAYLFYSNVLAGPDTGSRSPEPAKRAAGPAAVPVPNAVLTSQTAAPRAPNAARTRSEEFHPVVRSKRAEDRINPFDVDPTLRLDLFAKVQSVEQAGGSRNLFQFSTPPVKEPPPPLKGPEPKVKVGPVQVAEAKPTPPPPASAGAAEVLRVRDFPPERP
jgi:hypothetical protein